MADECIISFCELRCKEVINIKNGKRLGRIIDIIFDAECGKVKGIVAPFNRRFIFLKPNQDIFIPLKCVKKIGEDTILVEIESDICDLKNKGRHDGDRHDDHKREDHGHNKEHCEPRCDRRCDKCMFFDCGFRWKCDLDGRRGDFK